MPSWYVRLTALGIAVWILLLTFPHAAPASESLPCTSILAPRACYERYLSAIQQAGSLRDLHPFLSAARVQVLERGLANAKTAGADPAQIERATLDLLRRGSSAPSRIREQRFVREASLLVDRPGVTVEVRLIVERGAWRIDDERFRSTPRF